MANDRDDDIGIGAVLAGIAGLAGLVGTGVAAYKAVKKHSNRPSGRPMLQISSKMVSPNDYSNLLDFRKIRICAEHAAYCRVIPALAAGFCKTGFIDIRTNKKRIKEYSDHISDILREDDIQTEYAKDFIIQSINEAYENSDFSIFSVNDFISSRFPENAETFVRLALGLTQHMNGAAFYSLAQAVKFIGLSQNDVTSLAIEAGHSPSHIEFVKPYFESNYPMLDFRRTPVDDSYSTGTKMHLAYARLAPALATLAAKLANSDLRQQYNVPSYFEGTNEIRNYPTFIFMKDAETTIVSAYSENPEEAKKFAEFLVSKEELIKRFDITGQIPPRKDITVEDEWSQGILAQSQYAIPMPKITQIGTYWSAMGAAFANVWDGADPVDELNKAAAAMEAAR